MEYISKIQKDTERLLYLILKELYIFDKILYEEHKLIRLIPLHNIYLFNFLNEKYSKINKIKCYIHNFLKLIKQIENKKILKNRLNYFRYKEKLKFKILYLHKKNSINKKLLELKMKEIKTLKVITKKTDTQYINYSKSFYINIKI